MTAKVPTREATVAAAGMKVARRLPRKANTTRITRKQDAARVHSTSAREARIGGVRSISTVSLTSAGREAASWGSKARTLSTVSMMLAPGWRNTINMTDGRPLTRPLARTSSTESVILATSDKRTGAPFLYERISGSYCKALNNWSLVAIS